MPEQTAESPKSSLRTFMSRLFKLSHKKNNRTGRRRLGHKKQQGFTLIEVMVALTIIAISLTALISTSGAQANSVSYLKQKTLAHWVAMNELTQLRILGSLPDAGDKKGSTKMADHEWFWIRSSVKTEQENTRQITYIVFSDKDYQRNLTTLIGYVTQ